MKCRSLPENEAVVLAAHARQLLRIISAATGVQHMCHGYRGQQAALAGVDLPCWTLTQQADGLHDCRQHIRQLGAACMCSMWTNACGLSIFAAGAAGSRGAFPM
jgi:hypothetical protein